MTYRTLGDLRGELMARLGMGAMGASGASQTLMDSFLRNGQAQLYRMQDWKHLQDYKDTDLGVSANLLDYPTAGIFDTTIGCARDKRILRIETVYSLQWRRLIEGIDTIHWNTMDTLGYPVRFERLAQVLFYPKADVLYSIRFWFVRDLGRFTEENDRATLDDDMILLHAFATAKAHYRHPDAAMYQGQLAELTAKLKAQSFGSGREGVVYRRDTAASEPRPLLLGRDI